MRRLISYICLFILINIPWYSFGYTVILVENTLVSDVNSISPGDFKSDFEQARNLINDNQYQDALPILLKLVKDNPDNCNLNFLVGYCYYNIEQERNKALPYLEKAVNSTVSDYDDNSSKEKSAPVYAFFYLGKCYHWTGRLDAALTNLEKFRGFLVNKSDKLINQKNFEIFKDVNASLEQVKIAQKLVSVPLHLDFIKIPFVNTGNYSCYGAQLSDDGNFLYYSREKLNDKIRGKSDMYVLKRSGQNWIKNEQAGQNLNGPYNDNFNSISPDGKFLLYSSDRKGVYNIFYSLHENNKWSEPFDNLTINSNFEDTYAVLSKDGNKMYFVSNRPGGFGGKDIYKIEKKGDGSWTQPENLGFTINTPKDEDTPFLSADGNRLYFSSSGHTTIGGSDVFYSDYKNNMWLEPVNMGFPVNSVANDLYFKYYKDNNLILLSSNRKSGGINYEILGLRYSDSLSQNELFPVSKEISMDDTASQLPKEDIQPMLLQITKDSIQNNKPLEKPVKKSIETPLDTPGQQNSITLPEKPAKQNIETPQEKPKVNTAISQLSDKEKKARQDSVLKVRQKQISDSLAASRMASLKNELKSSKNQNNSIKAKIQQDSIARAQEIERKQALAKATQEKLKKLKEKARTDSIIRAQIIADSLRIAAAKQAAKDKFEQGQQLAEQAKTDTSQRLTLAKTDEPSTIKDAIALEKRRNDSIRQSGITRDSIQAVIAANLAQKKADEQNERLAKAKSDSIMLAQINEAKEKVKTDSIIAAQNLVKWNNQRDSLALVKNNQLQKQDTVIAVATKVIVDTKEDTANLADLSADEDKPIIIPSEKTETTQVKEKTVLADKPDEIKQNLDSLNEIKKQSEEKLTQYLENQLKKDQPDSTETPLQKTIHVTQSVKESVTPFNASDTVKRYTVQVGAGYMKIKYFKSIDQKKICYGPDGLPRFIVGVYATKKEAEEMAEQLRLLGFADAWVPALDNKRCVCPDNELLIVSKPDERSANEPQTAATTKYTVQVGAGNMKIRYFKALREVKACTGKDGLTRFTFGEYSSLFEAQQVKSKIVKLGYPDAWTPPIDENRCGGK